LLAVAWRLFLDVEEWKVAKDHFQLKESTSPQKNAGPPSFIGAGVVKEQSAIGRWAATFL
jgi:hypothetical protein